MVFTIVLTFNHVAAVLIPPWMFKQMYGGGHEHVHGPPIMSGPPAPIIQAPPSQTIIIPDVVSDVRSNRRRPSDEDREDHERRILSRSKFGLV